mgnify:CR=1 FL=1
MKKKLKTLKFYCHNIKSPLFIKNETNIPKEDLNHDLSQITDEEIKQFTKKYSNIVEIEKNRSKNENLIKNELKYYILGEKIQKILGATRIKCLFFKIDFFTSSSNLKFNIVANLIALSILRASSNFSTGTERSLRVSSPNVKISNIFL